MSFPPAPSPPTGLCIYRVLSSRAGIRVSPIQLGGMSIGEKWGAAFGTMNKESSFELLDAYFDMGRNFIDSANNYQDGDSERFIGEWAEQRGIREQLIIMTKYTMNYHGGNDHIKQKVNFVGNNAKSLQNSTTTSLKQLRTSYIDILYLHWWDWDTSLEEVMDSLHNLVLQGKVLYLVRNSDTPAWVVAQANQYVRDHGKTPFVIYQGHWNVMDRSFEREIIPMARSLGLALAPWDVLCGERLRTDEEEERRCTTGEKGRESMVTQRWERSEEEKAMCNALEVVTHEVSAKSITAVAIAYVMQKGPYVFPTIGGRKVEHLKANIEALDITLTEENIAFLESARPFDPGFPNNMIGDGSKYDFFGFVSTAQMVKQPVRQAIRPADVKRSLKDWRI
ncbi:Aldo/keto reductase [Guyanagaster necrorhizus]|uniref:Aldo/keto reductase n=1 Tax=Guyanagaster necrorhizus TaxID=856835 RepID=A0A9P7VRA1_9AGAR|nr:Aldo/keto reductase [Guyanagaster necrorhizus MCA 3950]KAG7444509.1 Aldo/keto reductase [Guyanagaster necrorhizus MCA 3950]